MDINRFTEKAQSALRDSQALAVRFGQQQIDGIVSFEPDAKPVLGKEYVVTIRLINSEHLGEALKKDAAFDWREGSKIVARAF